jgi:ABC-2 type transport system ATP-binding protein
MGQKNQLWWDLPAQESFRLHQQIYGIAPEAFRRTLGELTELLACGELLGRPVRELSLGERMKMELIAALLHSPEVLFLDEPTIGLDVVAQHNIQQFLKQYQADRRITVLLTSHYMKDVAALCKRVIVIAKGTVQYDGSLTGIIDRFSASKRITVQLAEGQSSQGLDRYGTVIKEELPRVQIQIPRGQVSRVLTDLLERYTVDDVAVEDPPLEEAIAGFFAEMGEAKQSAGGSVEGRSG